jgi:hypothetical protein
MEKSWKPLVLFVAFSVAGCAAANRPALNTNPDDIVLTAVTRAKDEWGCPEVTGALKGVTEPPKRQNWYDPVEPTQYRVAVAGCRRTSEYTVLCPQDGVRCYTIVPGEHEPLYIQEIVPGSGIFPKK